MVRRLLLIRRIQESKAMENGKDRSGENLAFDERSNEDSYFAAKEYELIDGMKAEFQKVEAARREGQIVNCPKCSGKLESYQFMDFKGELEAILRKAARGPLGAFFERYFSKDEPGKDVP
jgi:hypothetical protein